MHFRRRILKTSTQIDNGPELVWELVLLLVLTWIVSFFALWKGITKLRKVSFYMIHQASIIMNKAIYVISIRLGRFANMQYQPILSDEILTFSLALCSVVL